MIQEARTVRIEYLPLLQLLLAFDPANPKAHDLAAIDQSIDRFGVITPPTLNETTGKLSEGHGRVEALAARYARGAAPPTGVQLDANGAWLVPVIRGVALSPEAARRYLVVANRLVETGGWDWPALTSLLAELERSDDGLEGLGFDERELAKLVREFESPTADADADTPEALPTPTKTSVRVGDVYVLGDHRLAVGDAQDPAVLMALLHGEQPDLVWTDPPFGVGYVGRTSERLRITNDDLGHEGTRELLHAVFGNVRERLAPGTPYYVCAPGGDMEPALRDAAELLGPLRQQIVWAKNSAVLGRQDYHWRHELLLYGWVEGARHPWYGGRSEDTVWEVPKPSRSSQHPTMKPLELVRRALRNSSRTQDLVLDPFVGSGTTLIACEAMHRRARVIELDPRYAQSTIRRWERFTGKVAEKVSE